ncbi:MAG TPA: serine/threonine-protein kinase [Nannocystaceae bacterium]|nr:serine/threonine-protein kinase [Nannocystaceae bacterium]
MQRYVVLEEVGHGGMGRVLRAYDPKLQREVALKEVRSDLLGPEGARRLVAEARAMAKLSHPNVVAVYDVEEIGDDEVVLVMEYVAGRTITRWLATPRTWQEIVACFRRAGRGLAAAHAAGLLHRDFKPDNVIVGDDGRVRVTDFGLAREIALPATDEPRDPSPTSSTGDTTAGALASTLPYLAPERLMGGPADRATDQFAFCVALWEALFGARPFAGESLGELAFAMSAGPPQPPSSKVPARVIAAILRGLATDANARWPDLRALLDAIAYDPSQRRRRALRLVAGVAVVGATIVGVRAWASARAQQCSEDAAIAHLAGAWDDARRSEVAAAIRGIGAAYADDVLTRVTRSLDDYGSAWTRMHTEACAATTIRGEQSATVLDLRMACLQRAKVELVAVTQVLAQADAQTVQKAHDVLAALRPLERCADVAALQADVEPPLPTEADAVARAREHIALAWAEVEARHGENARAAADAAARELEQIAYAPVHTELALVRAVALDRLGDYAGAHAALRDTMQRASASHQIEELKKAATWLVFVVGYRLQHFDEALRYADIGAALAKGDALAEGRLHRSLGIVLDTRGQYPESEREHREGLAVLEAALGPDHVEVAESRFNLAVVLWRAGKLDEADAESRRALAARQRALGAEHPSVAAALANVAIILQTQGKNEAAEAEYRRALAIQEAAFGPDHPDAATTHRNLATVLLELGRTEEAAAEHQRALAVFEKTFGPKHSAVGAVRHDMAQVLQRQGRLEEAEQAVRAAITALGAALGEAHSNVAQAHYTLASILIARKRIPEAEAELRIALPTMEHALQPEHPYLAAVRTTFAAVLLERGAVAEARPVIEAAWRRRERDDVGPADRGSTAFVLARAWWADGERTQAIAMCERAIAELAAGGAGDGQEAREAKAWLAEHR